MPKGMNSGVTRLMTTAEELDHLNRLIVNALRTGIRRSGEPLSVVAGWAGVSEDSMRNYIRDGDRAQRMPLGRALMLVRRGKGFVRLELVNLFKQIIEKPSPTARD